MTWFIRPVIAGLFALALAANASAGIANSPLPILNGKKAVHLYTVLGAVSVSFRGPIMSVISCTSTATATIRVSFETFTEGGDVFTTDAMDVAPGATVTVSTQAVPGNAVFGANLVLGNGGGVGFGKPTPVRIGATSKALACTAFSYNNETAAISPLTIIAKTKQKAAN